jgi:phosphonate transport system substrate-binding protein
MDLGAWTRLVLLLSLVGVSAFAIASLLKTQSARDDKDQADSTTMRVMGLIEPTPRGLAARFADSQGRLLADPPATPDKIVDPQTLVVAHLESTDAENPSIPWPQFETDLAKATGRKVADQVFDNSPDQLAHIDDGGITLVELHAADTPFLVNNYGFQPVAVLGNDTGANGNHLDIIAAANSSIANPADLRGQTLVCTVPSSITGYRAAVALLMQNEGLRPNVDYFVTWSLGQKRSIEGVAHHEFAAAAISDDKLQSLLASGDVAASDYRIVYRSEVIPRTTIGWFYNINPDLAAKIRAAILSFRPDADSSKDDNSASLLHFIAIDYKRDFQLVREIDDRFDPRFDAKTKSKAQAAASPAS